MAVNIYLSFIAECLQMERVLSMLAPLPMRISRIPAPQRSVLFPATSRGVKLCVSLLLCPLHAAISRSSDFPRQLLEVFP